jgi:hypothetical protein
VSLGGIPLARADIVVRSRTGQPIAGAVVRAYGSAGRELVAETVTDEGGRARVLLPAGVELELRTFKFGAHQAMPRLVLALPDPAPNAIALELTPIDPASPRDLRLSAVSGFFRTPTGAPDADLVLHFHPRPPLLVDRALIVRERVAVRADASGHVETTLFRGAVYDVLVQGLEDRLHTITVPDAPTTRLPDLLFPVPAHVRWRDALPASVAAGAELALHPAVEWTDGTERTGPCIDVLRWWTDAPGVVEVLPAGDVLVLRGILRGEARIHAAPWRAPVQRIPDPPLSGVPLAVRIV